MSESNLSALVWFRRDLRCVDHAALYHALKNNRRVWCAFVFDSDILEPLPRQDRRVAFIRDSLIELDQGLRELALAADVPQPERVGLIVRYGSSRSVIPELALFLFGFGQGLFAGQALGIGNGGDGRPFGKFFWGF